MQRPAESRVLARTAGRCRRAFSALVFLFCVLLAAPWSSPAAPAPPSGAVRVGLEQGLTAVLDDSHGIFLEVVPKRGEGLYALVRRLCGDEKLAPQVAEANGGSHELHVGGRYRIPYGLLSQEWQLKVTRGLFPGDRGESDGWRHLVRGVGPLQRESLWHLSEWFTGTGENFRAIREYNELKDDDVPRGGTITIPAELLRPSFRSVLPVPETPYQLDYGSDKDGEYAIYRLRPGEALYSSVVVRFTGRVHGPDVNSLAAEIAKRSGIADVTDIPIGYRVKIPYDVLQPEFLPEGHPRRKEYEAELRASARFSNQIRAKGLTGITIILDAGHGGHDSGATMGGVWESLYVYDIVMRVQRLLAGHTAARVHVTTRDGDQHRVVDVDVLPFSRRHAVLTTPPYLIEDSTVGVNLRWYLANSVYRRAVGEGNDPQKVVFLSVHADSLHPSLRGAMAYIPAASLRGDSAGKSGQAYASRKEVQESPRVTFTEDQRVRSEGLSRELAKELIAAFHAGDLPIHPFKPVRDKVIRNKSVWVPAVLRYNTVPAKVLLEVCNLANEQDRRLIQTRAYRQQVAEAIVQGLLAYYGEDSVLPPSQIAATAK
ncbi:MAG TPA: N-acetylmuramoyl-L-alanine amidase [Thermoanaerobaculia bacterium]|nr:N-acetylmuramoyl-L-alanine amidase [Thermoanaerobaculia bacterium]